MESMMLYGGNNILNKVLSKFYQSNPNNFNGSGTSGGFGYSFNVATAPVCTLISGNANKNFEISLSRVSMSISQTNGAGPSLKRSVTMKATGKFGIASSRLSFTSLTVQIADPSPIDSLIVGVINSDIVPLLQQSLMNIPLPQFHNILSTSLSAQVRTGQVISGPALEIGTRITGKPNTTAADSPSSADLASLNNGTTNNALIMGLVSADAVNVLIKAVLSNLSQAFNKSGTAAGFGAGIKGTIKATIPVLSINNGNGSIKTTVSITGFKAGIRNPITGWTWFSISVPSVNATITHALTNEGNKGIVKLTGVSALSVNLNWPAALSPVASVVKNLLNAVLAAFKTTISNTVSGKKFEIFKLPGTIPGTTISSTLSFPSGGLSYFKGSVRAKVKVSN